MTVKKLMIPASEVKLWVGMFVEHFPWGLVAQDPQLKETIQLHTNEFQIGLSRLVTSRYHYERIWRILQTGTHQGAQELIAELGRTECEMTAQAVCLLQKPGFRYDQERRTVDLVRFTVRDLGFTEPVDKGKVVGKAHEGGYRLCPDDTAAQLCLQGFEPCERRIFPITLGIHLKDGTQSSLVVEPGEKPRLGTCAGGMGDQLNPQDLIVLEKRRLR